MQTLQAIGADVIVMRHSRSGAPYLAARHATARIVNAGDGLHAHPTQALLDLYTMRARLGDVRGRRVVIVGDVLHSRVARSNIWLLTSLGAEVVVCAPPTLVPRGLGDARESRTAAGARRDRTSIVAIRDADVVMALRMQNERMQGGFVPGVREYSRLYQVNDERLARARPGVSRHAPGPDERRRRDQPRCRARSAVAGRRAGGERRRRADGGALADHARRRQGAAHERAHHHPRRPRHRPGERRRRDGRLLDRGRRVSRRSATTLAADGAREIDAQRGLVVAPGFVDIHTHLRDPGLEYKEDIASGTRAAARGGFTTVCAMPNTEPAMDNRATVEYVLRKAAAEAVVRVLPIGAVSDGAPGRRWRSSATSRTPAASPSATTARRSPMRR